MIMFTFDYHLLIILHSPFQFNPRSYLIQILIILITFFNYFLLHF